jgi:hypothetical protein
MLLQSGEFFVVVLHQYNKCVFHCNKRISMHLLDVETYKFSTHHYNCSSKLIGTTKKIKKK